MLSIKQMNPRAIDEIVNQVIDEFSLEEKVKVANLEDDEIEFINKLITNYITTRRTLCERE